MTTRPIHLCWLLLLLTPWPAAAQTAPDTTVVLPEVRVESTRATTEAATAAGRVTLLDAEALQATSAGTVAALLEARTGLFVKRYGSGGLATLSMRGAGSAHTLLLVDGLRVADPQTGQVDLSLLPTVLLESVEVFHGASGVYGSEGLGGVVRLGTLHADGPARIRVAGGYGAYAERSLGVVAAGGRGRLSGVAAIEASAADGDFSYLNETLFPVREVRREGADRSLLTLFSRVAYRDARQRVSLAGWYNDAERGLPGPGNAASGNAHQEDRHLRLWLHSETRLAGGTLDVKGGVQQTALRYINPLSATDQTSRTRSFDLDARLSMAAARRWLAVGGASVGIDRAEPLEDAGPSLSALGVAVGQTRLSAFAQGTGDLGRWLLYPALRVDLYTSEGKTTGAVIPRLGVNVQPLARAGLRLKGSVGRAFRAPTFNERFWQPGGNPDLKAEHGWSGDAGLHVQGGRGAHAVEAEATVFATSLRDQIVWRPGFVDPSVQVWRPANLGRVVTRGLEVSLQGRLRPAVAALDGGLAYTFTDAQDRSDPATPSYGKPLRYVPRRQLTALLGVGRDALRLDLSARLVGPRFLTTDGTMALPAYRVLDAQLRYRRALGRTTATLALGVENVFDSAYTIVRFYPMPPRHARLRLILDFHP